MFLVRKYFPIISGLTQVRHVTWEQEKPENFCWTYAWIVYFLTLILKCFGGACSQSWIGGLPQSCQANAKTPLSHNYFPPYPIQFIIHYHPIILWYMI
jgi:hypothetical protein